MCVISNSIRQLHDEVLDNSAGELNGFYLQPSVGKITTEALNQSAGKLYPTGSILVGMYDTAALKMGVLDKAAASNQVCACLIPNESILVEWLYTAISIMKPFLLSQRKGCRQKNLILKMIKEFKLPIAGEAARKTFHVFAARVAQKVAEVEGMLGLDVSASEVDGRGNDGIDARIRSGGPSSDACQYY